MDVQNLKMVKLGQGDALIVLDMQNDFMPGGALPVAEGDTIVGGVNDMMRFFYKSSLPVILTQDWHPKGHRSFASAHSRKKPFDLYEEPGIGPVLWPDHCVQGSLGADFHRGLETVYSHAIIRKGYRLEIDSYSGFLENDKSTKTGLDGYLRSRNVIRIFTCGLTLDYCVFYTAADGADFGFKVVVLTGLTKPVALPPDSVSHAIAALMSKGVKFAATSALRL